MKSKIISIPPVPTSKIQRFTILVEPSNQMICPETNTALRFIGGKILMAADGGDLPESDADNIFEKYLYEVAGKSKKDVFVLPIYYNNREKGLSLLPNKGFKKTSIKGYIYLEKTEIIKRCDVEKINTETYDSITMDFRNELAYQNNLTIDK
ncbi:MAG: hypothetical protein VYA60_05180 [Pseudomonadota bacterium]|nr:hypothetical protein [Pseudomonadota bacterium]